MVAELERVFAAALGFAAGQGLHLAAIGSGRLGHGTGLTRGSS
jgi:hypothetical protein